MKERRESLISIPPDWDPAAMADLIEREAVRWWDEGWVFLRAEADALLESVCLYFERTVFLEEDLPPPGGAAPGGPGRLKPPRP
ncbi:MAG TPA: hypothetical protein VK465_01505 [Fibrobacteria bacterium]|nr:hypothetical protein [Fibrobacteria bacterium]